MYVYHPLSGCALVDLRPQEHLQAGQKAHGEATGRAGHRPPPDLLQRRLRGVHGHRQGQDRPDVLLESVPGPGGPRRPGVQGLDGRRRGGRGLPAGHQPGELPV